MPESSCRIDGCAARRVIVVRARLPLPEDDPHGCRQGIGAERERARTWNPVTGCDKVTGAARRSIAIDASVALRSPRTPRRSVRGGLLRGSLPAARDLQRTDGELRRRGRTGCGNHLLEPLAERALHAWPRRRPCRVRIAAGSEGTAGANTRRAVPPAIAKDEAGRAARMLVAGAPASSARSRNLFRAASRSRLIRSSPSAFAAPGHRLCSAGELSLDIVNDRIATRDA